MKIFDRLKSVLKKSRDSFTAKLHKLFAKKLDAATLEELEETLIEAGFGVSLTSELLSSLTAQTDPLSHLKERLFDQLLPGRELLLQPKHVILLVGINGSGKTTTCAKLGQLLQQRGTKILMAAADTFRAAAQQQLALWCQKLSIPLITGPTNADPASVVVEALQRLQNGQEQLLLIDTAGRLESKEHLMRELEKVRSVLAKRLPGAPQDTFLVLDATMGQNALAQARTFHQSCPLTGIILTKVDSLAKPGVLFAMQKELQIPVLFLGCGEKEEDLLAFEKKTFIDSLF